MPPFKLIRKLFHPLLILFLLIVLISGGTGYTIWRLRTAELEKHLELAAMKAHLFESYLTQQLDATRLILEQGLEKADSSNAKAVEYKKLLRRLPVIRSISFIDDQGKILFSSNARNVGVTFMDTDLLPLFDGSTLLRFDVPWQGRDFHSGNPTTPRTPVNPRQRNFLPVLLDSAERSRLRPLAAINPDFLLNYLLTNVPPGIGCVDILRYDGVLLLSTDIRESPGTIQPFSSEIDLSVEEFGKLEYRHLKRKPTLTAFRASPHFPLLVLVHLNRERALETWAAEARGIVIHVGIALALLITVSLLAYRLFRRVKQRENEIQRQQELSLKLYETSDVGIMITDKENRIKMVNPAFSRITGYSSEDVLRKDPRLLSSGQQSASFYRTMWDAIEKRGRWSGEIVNKRKDGQLVYEWLKITKLMEEGEDGFCYLGVFTDLTDRREKERAEAANQAKSAFLANMSHEIRTPMNPIINMTRLLMETDLSPQQQDYAQTILDSSNILLSLINDILDLSKIEAGKLKLEPVVFDINEQIDDITKLVGPKAQDKGLYLTCHIASDVWPFLYGDALRLRQILLNYVINAVKFTQTGGVSIHISKEKRENDKDQDGRGSTIMLCFVVRDTGIGIPENKLSLLFKNFSQGDTSTTRKYGGTGLGLAISKQLAELMGGTVGVESIEGKGSQFWFTALFEKRPEAHKPESITPQREISNDSTFTGLRILLVEDNRFNQKVAVEILKRFHLSVDIAHNGNHALEILKETSYDLIFMDIDMPEMDGLEATRIIRESDMACANVPIIAMTAHAMSGDRNRFLRKGFTDYVTKPVDPDIFFHVISKHLRNNAPRIALHQTAPMNAHSSILDRETQGKGEDMREIFDQQAFLKRLGNNQAAFKQMIPIAKQEIQKNLTELQKALNENDLNTIAMVAHAFKGVCGNFSANALCDLILEIETAAKKGTLNNGEEIIERLNREYDRLIHLLDSEYLHSS